MGNKNKNKKANNIANLNLNNSNQNNNEQLQAINNIEQTSTTKIFVAPILMRQITEEEYQNLKKENIDLQTRFLYITNNERLLQETIKNAKKLTDENDKLREENKILNEKIKELENNLIGFKKENKELNNDIFELKNENKELRNDINKIKNKELFNKYIIAIQDANRYLHFYEKKLSVEALDDLKELKYNRIESCHYLDNDYEEERKKEYLNSLYSKIINISPEIKQMFDSEYPNLLSEIAPIIDSNSLKSTKYSKRLNIWWN
jgi:predicted RNase H-like nuclease (RuvC/YqgF family)